VSDSKNTPASSSPPRFTEADASKYLKRGYEALRSRNYKDAGACCGLVLKYMPKAKEAHFLVGLIGIESKDWRTAKQALQNVVALDDTHAAAWAQLARVYTAQGQYANGETALERAAALEPIDPLVQDVIGTVYSLLGDQHAALRWFDKACAGSSGAAFELSRAKSLTFLGDMPAAKTALEAVLSERPNTAQAHWMLSRIEKASDDQHICQMQALLDHEASGGANAPFLYYAMGKEREDLGQWDSAFQAYQAGAKARRAEVVFDEAAEDAMFEALGQAFTADWLAAQMPGNPESSPIFVIGQPRTGTTLVERIMTAHSDIGSAGELQQFGMAIKRMVGASAGGPLSVEAVEKAATIDTGKLGQMYLDTIRTVRGDAPYFVDKLPTNYLYAPLIAAALPNAKIIHIVRGPMDSCFASYKQLFAEAYYHSYDQAEMARHHIRYRNLMEKWRMVLGERILDVYYEDVVADLPCNARKLIDFLGLEWQDNCLDFHEQTTAVTTASAAQVREKVHTRSVGRWKKYQELLGPMKKALSAAKL